jgi:hypothetical protein
LVSAKVSSDKVAQAEAVLNNKSADIVERGNAYRSKGWDRFDPEAPAYTTDEVDRERVAYADATRY